MITARLKGGLGNQMFQISTAYALARESNNEFAIDFNITHYGGQGHPHKKYKDNLYKDIPQVAFKDMQFDIYNEPYFHYAPVPTHSGNLMIDGYFQCEQYFVKYRNDIINLFTFPEDIIKDVDKKIQKIKDKFNKDELVCVHVRRGEYTKLPTVHAVQPKEYYLTAMEKFDPDKVVYVIISDTMPWCEENLNVHDTVFCNTGYDWFTEPRTDDLNELFDLYLSLNCNHNIIPNSSFGWWGAWLNEHKNRVYAPTVWFGPDGPQDYQDMFCKGWKKLNIK